ncbi:unnamed protein product [Polarella glacialis]|uniref:Transmembrane protein n=1 Tax=Polarella glacialis TaxID=89957 RepID=A0A813EKP7_POLGL|nr:unnamed protein product [Polarella glacialis]
MRRLSIATFLFVLSSIFPMPSYRGLRLLLLIQIVDIVVIRVVVLGFVVVVSFVVVVVVGGGMVVVVVAVVVVIIVVVDVVGEFVIIFTLATVGVLWCLFSLC